MLSSKTNKERRGKHILSKYIIITESTSDLTKEIILKHNIKVMPMLFHLDSKTYKDNVLKPELEVSKFYEILKSGKFPTTSQLNPNDYEDFITPFLKDGYDVLIISFSSALSGTHNSGRIAVETLKQTFPTRNIKIVDTLSASLGEGLLVYLAALEKEKGATLDEVHAFVEKTKLHLAHWFTVTDINHLKRGGRISGVQSFVAKTLNIKPILHVNNEGKLISRTKAMGRGKSIKALADQFEKTATDIKQTVFIGHGDDLVAANELKNLILKVRPESDVTIATIGPVIGAHAGQGVIALFFIASNR